jgi:uncharacterized membrane protein YtjA (UPF0391 family)
MSIPTILFVVALALILAAIEQARARGRSLTGWAVIFVCIGLLWGVLR